MNETRTALVTGGAGFIGSHLCERLVTAGEQVVCVDNLQTGTEANIAHLFDEPQFKFTRHDIVEPLSIKVNAIYNLACPASPVHYQSDPIRTTKTSVLGALNALELARCCSAPVLQASTSEVYGDPLVHPQPESYWGHVNPIGERACYDEGKRCAETLFFDHRRRHRLRIKVARIFNTYGPRMQSDDGRVVSNFIVQALRNDPITIYGDGSQTRSFCYIDDLVEAIVLLMGSADEVVGPINLGNPHEFSVRQLGELVLALTGSRSRLVFKRLPPDDPKQRKPDILRAREMLGWEPVVQLKDGLLKTIAYFDTFLSLRAGEAKLRGSRA